MKRFFYKQQWILALLLMATSLQTLVASTDAKEKNEPPCIVNIQSWIVPNTGLIGLYASLDACDSSNLFLEYEWSNGATTQYIEVADPGNYCVTVTASLLGTTIVDVYSGCQDITQPCAATIARTGNILTYTGYGSPVVSALWSTGETTESIVTNGLGTYSVALNHEGGCSSEASINLQDTFCYAIIEEFTNPAGGTYLQAFGDPNESYTVTWYVNGQLVAGTTVDLTVEGNYTAVLDYSYGCQATVQYYYDITLQCTGSVGYSNNGNGSATLYVTGNENIDEIEWYKVVSPNNYIVLGNALTLNIVSSGHYCFDAINTAGCTFSNCLLVDTILPYADSTCYAWITAVVNSDGSTTLTANSLLSGGQFNWSNGVLGNSITVPSDEGEYCVTYSNDSTNCESTNCIVFGELDCNVWITQSQFGTPDVTLTANSNTTGTYLWSTGETGPSIVVSTDGTYIVTFSDGNGCTASASVDIDISNDECNYTINVGIDTINGIPSYVVDTANLLGTYFWSDGTVGPILLGFDPNAGYYLFFTGVDGCDIVVYVGPGNPTDSIGTGDGTISGIVSEDPDGLAGVIQEILVRNGETPMAGAAVQLKDWNGSVKSRITGIDGVYDFSQLAYGTYELRFIAPGKSPYTRTIELNAADHDFTVNVTVGKNSILKGSGLNQEILTIYPNPANGLINFDLPANIGNSEIRVFDTSGRQVKFYKSYTAGQFKMDVSALQSGIYTINIVSGDKVFTGKLVKI